MTEFPETRSEILLRIQSPQDREAWDRFTSMYRPVIYRMARRRGLQDADAQDLVQRVLLSVASSIERWEKREGLRFRNWLRRVTKNAALNALSRQPRDLGQGGTEAQNLLDNRPGTEPEHDRDFELESRREIFHRAAAIVQSEVRKNTWIAFELSVIHDKTVKQVAEELRITVGGVYAAQGRVMDRLRKVVADIEREES